MRDSDLRREGQKLTKGSQRRNTDPRVTETSGLTKPGRDRDPLRARQTPIYGESQGPTGEPQTLRPQRRRRDDLGLLDSAGRPGKREASGGTGTVPAAAAAHLPSSQGSCDVFLREGNIVGGGGGAWGLSSPPGGPGLPGLRGASASRSAQARQPRPSVLRVRGSGRAIFSPELRHQRFRMPRNS